MGNMSLNQRRSPGSSPPPLPEFFTLIYANSEALTAKFSDITKITWFPESNKIVKFYTGYEGDFSFFSCDSENSMYCVNYLEFFENLRKRGVKIPPGFEVDKDGFQEVIEGLKNLATKINEHYTRLQESK